MALLAPKYLEAVVAIGSQSPDGAVKYDSTGFLYGYSPEEEKERRWVFLVTNRHVAERSGNLYCRFSSEDSLLSLPLAGSDVTMPWTFHPNPAVDAAALMLNAPTLEARGIALPSFDSNVHALFRPDAGEGMVAEGDGVFILGFPMGLAGDERNAVIVRRGTIARVQEWLKGNATTFLVDSFIFPGNSGGPVFTVPQPIAVEGTASNPACSLIGMISSYLPYQDFAVSTQTQRVRVIFEENSGLCTVVPVDLIQETVETALREAGLRRAAQAGEGVTAGPDEPS